MPAYVIVETHITDPVAIEEYRKLSPAAVARYGGRFLARGGEVAVLEGDWTPPRLVVVEFPDMDTARAFYDSPEYRHARAVRAGAGSFRMVVVEGV